MKKIRAVSSALIFYAQDRIRYIVTSDITKACLSSNTYISRLANLHYVYQKAHLSYNRKLT